MRMAKINMTRVILGGVLAGLVVNIGEYFLNTSILGKLMEASLQALNRPQVGNEGMAFYVVLGFAVGIFAIWVYAAIRPRFGAGTMTAICAGLMVWFLVSLYASAGLLPLHLFPRRLLLYGVIWTFFEFPLAVIAGAWIYKEDT